MDKAQWQDMGKMSFLVMHNAVQGYVEKVSLAAFIAVSHLGHTRGFCHKRDAEAWCEKEINLTENEIER